jgi:organic hydroperoxide reductase OsmC/OhrA
MSEHRVAFAWTRGDAAFDSQSYPRSYEMRFPGGVTVPGGPALEFGGVAGRVDPEQALVAALSACHALTFLALAAKRRLVVDAYEDDASCTLGKNADGKSWVDQVRLQPKVTFASPVDDAALQLLHEQAHRYCFIANSVKSEVRVEPRR